MLKCDKVPEGEGADTFPTLSAGSGGECRAPAGSLDALRASARSFNVLAAAGK